MPSSTFMSFVTGNHLESYELRLHIYSGKVKGTWHASKGYMFSSTKLTNAEFYQGSFDVARMTLQHKSLGMHGLAS